jgi:hypothetical protein
MPAACPECKTARPELLVARGNSDCGDSDITEMSGSVQADELVSTQRAGSMISSPNSARYLQHRTA